MSRLHEEGLADCVAIPYARGLSGLNKEARDVGDGLGTGGRVLRECQTASSHQSKWRLSRYLREGGHS